MSSSSHHPSPFSHLNNNNIGGSGSTQNSIAPAHHNNLQQHHPDYDEFEDVDNEQTQQQQELLFDDGPVAEDENMDDSGEDTEEASETELGSSSNHRNIDEPIEIKEQMYQDKLASLKKQLEELRAGTHPEYVRRVKKLEHQYNERIRLNEIYREYLISCVERDYILEKNAAVKEYEEKKNDLQENLVTDFEDRRKMIESERATMELTGDSIDVKPTVTRKLRRRPNEPLPVPEKRRKPTTGQLILLLDEKEVENDLKLISRGKPVHAIRTHTNSTSNAGNGSSSQNANSTSLATGMVSPVANSYQINNSSTATTTGAASSSTTNEISISTLPSSTLNSLHPIPSQLATIAPSPTPTHSQNLNQNNHQPQPQQQAPPPSGSQQPPNNPPPQPPVQPPQPVQQQPQPQQQPPPPPPPPPTPLVETKIEDGKLLYERRWFHRGQPVYVEGKDIPRFSANISAIGSEAIWVKKTSDGQKVRIFTNQLSRGKVSIKRRAN
ncbi:sin3 histone deacetylase corepressor complex component SDS3-like [Ochlerotatus camptorhynchus]|uniref:sin3 histone deacetylase corepressor complex component SDS3-like n=1 Tax=Ochlerotatus camptorhynchus TaxID=644619 RepID=UPI0031D73993